MLEDYRGGSVFCLEDANSGCFQHNSFIVVPACGRVVFPGLVLERAGAAS